MKNKILDQLNQDYLDFLSAEGTSPANRITEKIKNKVRKELKPNFWLILSKLSFIHLLSGMVTLTLCPQFGFGLFGVEMGLMQLFSLVGSQGCYILCGAFFMGMTLMTAVITLKPEEIRELRHFWPLQILFVILISLGFFIMLKLEIVLGFAALWILGSFLGGFVFMELGWWLRIYFRNKSILF